MPYIIQILGLASGEPSSGVGQWVHRYDPDAQDGRGELFTSSSVQDAQRFPTTAAVIAFYQQQSKHHPWRGDGEPNKPLTAYTVMVEKVEA
jgi:hypothetical protein